MGKVNKIAPSDLMMDTFFAVVDKHNIHPSDMLQTLVAMTRVAVLATYGQEEFNRFSETLKDFALTSPFQPPTAEPTKKDREFLKSLRIKFEDSDAFKA